jgi:hypothetical protein
MIFWAMSRSPKRIFSGRPIYPPLVRRLFDHGDVAPAFWRRLGKRQESIRTGKK